MPVVGSSSSSLAPGQRGRWEKSGRCGAVDTSVNVHYTDRPAWPVGTSYLSYVGHQARAEGRLALHRAKGTRLLKFLSTRPHESVR